MGSSVAKEAFEKEKKECLALYADANFTEQGFPTCPAAYDGFLCWPPTYADESVNQTCPLARMSNVLKNASRQCGPTGRWVDKDGNETEGRDYTDFSECFPDDVRELLDELYENDAESKYNIAQNTRYMEITGFSLSFVSLIVSLFIFSYFRSLRNNRTRIHKNLFSAMVLQEFIRLYLYFDQEYVRNTIGDSPKYEDESQLVGLENIAIVCEFAYIILEFAISAMFMWMFLEGLYLTNLINVNSLRHRVSHRIYFIMGWGFPLLNVILWASVNAYVYSSDNVKRCWYGYNYSDVFWILQGPRIFILSSNFGFLLNILRVLIMKLRRSEDSRVTAARKAVRAALVLVPLLGMTNILSIVQPPLNSNVWVFAIWSYTTHFFRAFQGCFLATSYCFINDEVITTIEKHCSDYRTMRATNRRRQRSSLFSRSSRTHQADDRWSTVLALPLRHFVRFRGAAALNPAIMPLPRPQSLPMITETPFNGLPMIAETPFNGPREVKVQIEVEVDIEKSAQAAASGNDTDEINTETEENTNGDDPERQGNSI